ncbi:MAG: acyltransferase [Gemmatimonadaceae bacterium]|nr:acyltransferase [Gemmatimonadaceae bacterium]
MSSPRPPFRPDIEGLRGAAILLVVLFHAGVPALAGGFVGVDLFFVLSGYFITGLLVREQAESGGVNLMEFYGRRALRLLPSLIVVLLVTLAAVMWLYAPIDQPTIAANARAVALSAGNYEFARTAVDYFSSAANPLLHTWSLAVEEQFYVVWPLLFLLLGAMAERRLLAAFAIAGLASFAASLWLTTTAQPWAFFGMPTRIWEFALGGVVALLLRPSAERDARRGALLQIAALAAIGFAVISYDRATSYPGVAALVPALAAAALLVGGAWAPASAASRMLSTPALQWLGRLSYAWYLWHWPLMGIGAVLDRDIGVGGRLVWSGAALGLAWLTQRFIESSAREGRLARIRTEWLAPAALVVSVGAALVAHGALRVAERRVASPEQRTLAMARRDRMQHDCWATTVDDLKGPCELGDRTSSTVIMLLGDSHAEHWLAGLDRAGRERGWKIVAMVKGGCPVADMPELMNARLKRYYHECTRYREAMLQRIVSARPAAVILSSWDHYIPPDGTGSDWQVTPEMWRRGLRRTYERLTGAGLPVVAIRGTPRTWFDVPACLSRQAARLPFAGPCSYERARSLSPAALEAQAAAARGLPIRFVDMNDQICPTRECGVVRNGVVVFTDDNHLTASFSRSMAPVLGARLAAALGLPVRVGATGGP